MSSLSGALIMLALLLLPFIVAPLALAVTVAREAVDRALCAHLVRRMCGDIPVAPYNPVISHRLMRALGSPINLPRHVTASVTPRPAVNPHVPEIFSHLLTVGLSP